MSTIVKPVATFKFAASLAALAMLGPFAVDAYLPAFPNIAESLSTSVENVQLTFFWYVIAFAVMNLLHGVVSDAIGRRPVLLFNFCVFIVASIGCIFSDDWQTLCMFRFLQGAAAGAGVVVAHAISRDCFDGVVAQRMVSYGALTYAIAPALAPVVGGYLAVAFGWQSIFVFLLTYSVVVLFWIWRCLPETHPVEARQLLSIVGLWQSYREVLFVPEFYFVTIISSLNFAAGFLYIAASSAFVLDHLKLSQKGFAWLFFPLVLGNMCGAFLASRANKDWHPFFAIKCGFRIMFVAAFCNVFVSFFIPAVLPWPVIPLFLYAVGCGMAAPSLIVLLFDAVPFLRGTASSLRWFVQNMLLALVVVIAPWASANLRMLSMTMFVMVCASIFTWIVFSNRHQAGNGRGVGVTVT